VDQPVILKPRRVYVPSPLDDVDVGDFCVVLSCDGVVGAVAGGYPSFDAAASDTERLQQLHGAQWEAVVFPLSPPLALEPPPSHG
jgi:hypothetical protein